jgi:hypothetical protein
MMIRLSRVEWDLLLVKERKRTDLSIIRQDFPRSSNVARLAYDTETESLYIEFNDGSVYEYLVDFDTFQNVLRGRASARTNGENEFGRWWEGKNPSVGAAVHQYLVSEGVDYREIGIMP